MANVDRATRILNFVASDEFNKKSIIEKNKIINDFSSISNREKPTSFRNVNDKDLSIFFYGLNSKVKSIISKVINNDDIVLIEDSQDNRVGADLIVISKNTRVELRKVELKFGSETNRNIGNNTMDKIFSITNENYSFSSLFSDISTSQRNFISKNNLEPKDSYFIDKNLDKILDGKINVLQNLLENNKLILNRGMMSQLLLSTGSIDNFTDKEIIKINISYNLDMNKAIKILDLPNVEGNWEIKSIEKSPQSTRIVIFVNNDFITTKFLLNWKNNYTFKGLKYSAKLGLGSTSWNVWVLI